MSENFRPIDHQSQLKQDQFILKDAQVNEENVPMDVLFVGAGPAGLVGAIRLAQISQEKGLNLEIGVLEKAGNLGGHSLSGAVMNPVVLKKLFPDLSDSDFPFQGAVKGDSVYMLTETGKIPMPTPPTMHNKGNYVASLSETVRWLGEKAEAMGINIFTSFPADALMTEGNKIVGVRTTPAGLDRDGNPGSQHMPATDITAKVTVLTEGTRGPLAQSYMEWQGLKAKSPQIYALGVKELWRVKKQPKNVTHTLGWPLPKSVFGGSWMYPMGDDMVSLGLVAGMDYENSKLDVHALLQDMKKHPLFKQYLDGGELLEWGAKTIPEGGLHAIPDRLVGDGLIMAGDCVGFVNVPALKGIHYAMEGGYQAAETIAEAAAKDDFSKESLASYDERVRSGFIFKDLKKVRNMRFAFKDGFWSGSIKAALMTITGGAFPGDPSSFHDDAEEKKAPGTEYENTGLSKVDGVYQAGNKTRDDIPSHLTVGKDVPKDVAEMYVAMCPAGVYEMNGDELVVNAPNCVDCKATDVLGPRWQPREGGAGPDYKQM